MLPPTNKKPKGHEKKQAKPTQKKWRKDDLPEDCEFVEVIRKDGTTAEGYAGSFSDEEVAGWLPKNKAPKVGSIDYFIKKVEEHRRAAEQPTAPTVEATTTAVDLDQVPEGLNNYRVYRTGDGGVTVERIEE